MESKSVEINVTRKHIDEAKGGSKHCPIALAMKDAGFKQVAVGVMSARGTLKKTEHTHYLSKKLQKFIERFDRIAWAKESRKGLKPFKFTFKLGGQE